MPKSIDTSIFNEVGLRINSLAESKKVSLNRLAREIPMDSSQLYRALRGQESFTSEKIMRISEVLGENVDFILYGKQDKKEIMDENSYGVIDKEDIKSLIQAAKDSAAAAKSAADAVLIQARNNEQLTLMVNAGYKPVEQKQISYGNVDEQLRLVMTNYEVAQQFALILAVKTGFSQSDALALWNKVRNVVYSQEQETDTQAEGTGQGNKLVSSSD